jgi:hypothetical protein
MKIGSSKLRRVYAGNGFLVNICCRRLCFSDSLQSILGNDSSKYMVTLRTDHLASKTHGVVSDDSAFSYAIRRLNN